MEIFYKINYYHLTRLNIQPVWKSARLFRNLSLMMKVARTGEQDYFQIQSIWHKGWIP